MKRKTKIATRNTLLITASIIGMLMIISFFAQTDYKVDENVLSDQVKEYRPLVEKYAEKYGVEEHVDIMLAMMMQESGGRGNDPMQSSESFCGERKCIKDPEVSIKQGVYYFSETLKAANGDLELAIQSYNFGRGFIEYALDKKGKYTQEVAINFSQKMYRNDEDKAKYRCPREGAREIKACYGDIYYVKDILAMREKLNKE
ncbi:lysozyme family protein [Virgibacillus flavescens]|uniref:lysozyme family protein n=1 Tax=Virgibacillus flavescens TaxID=1611422 RepID=UPI003D33E07E